MAIARAQSASEMAPVLERPSLEQRRSEDSNLRAMDMRHNETDPARPADSFYSTELTLLADEKGGAAFSAARMPSISDPGSVVTSGVSDKTSSRTFVGKLSRALKGAKP